MRKAWVKNEDSVAKERADLNIVGMDTKARLPQTFLVCDDDGNSSTIPKITNPPDGCESDRDCGVPGQQS